ncbi:MAG: AIR synthase-related protein [Pseudomonadota bacterium]
MLDAVRIEVHPRLEPGGRIDVYTITPPPADPAAVAARVADPVTQVGIVWNSAAPALDLPQAARHAVEIGLLPGVTDNLGHSAEEMLRDAGLIDGETRVHASRLYLTDEAPDTFAAARHNPLIEHARVLPVEAYARAGFEPVVPQVHLGEPPATITVPLPDDAEDLAHLSAHGIEGPEGPRGPLGLSADDFAAIRAHYASLGRDPTDVELETLAQSWSEHCKHRIFAAAIDGDVTCERGLFKSFVARATEEITARPDKDGFCISVFSDNAGAIRFDDEWMVCDKVETHNSPSALDPYGGAMTGIVGVNRDCLGFGLGAKPIANRYGFCFGEPGDARPLYRDAVLQNPLPSVHAIMHGVVRGIEDGGNQSGIPTVQGFVVHDDSYRGKPLVYCGTVGLLPRRLPDGRAAHEKGARPGDAIVMAGGRVGKDGIHGATFSSLTLDAASPATAVQIGDPITQKRMSDAILSEARDAGLYTSITDNGAGGLSSSIGEMARESGGAVIHLDRVPLKYAGLQPWEIWISEAQERMTLAVPPQHVASLVAIFARHGVEATEIGAFTDDGSVRLTYDDETVGELSLDFLHEGAPRLALTARKPVVATPAELPAMPDLSDVLTRLLARPDLASRARLARLYDHEVQSTSLIKPLQGSGAVKGDATAVAPVTGSPRAVGLTEAMLPHLTEADPHACAILTVDLAIRRLVAIGVDPAEIALLDNICWSSPETPERVWQLHETMRGAYEAAVHFGAPFVSGKDSMYNDFKGFDADGAALHVAALPTLLISALGILKDRAHAQTMDFKVPGDIVALVGGPGPRLGGSAYARLMGWADLPVPRGLLIEEARYHGVHAALRDGAVASAQAIGPGGLGVALARSAMAGRLGADISLPSDLRPDQTLFYEGAGQMLISLVPGAFEALRDPLDLLPLGTVTERPNLTIQAGDIRLGHPLDTLAVASARHPLGGPS